MMRGSRDFPSVGDYEEFLEKLFARLNAGRRTRLAEEMRVLRPLPERRFDTTRRMKVRTSPGSLIPVHHNTYSVHSRLIGELVEVGLKPDTVEAFYAERKGKIAAAARARQAWGGLPAHHRLAGAKAGRL